MAPEGLAAAAMLASLDLLPALVWDLLSTGAIEELIRLMGKFSSQPMLEYCAEVACNVKIIMAL